MLNLVPGQHEYFYTENPMKDGFFKYLKNITTMTKGGTLCVDDKTVHIMGEQDLLSVKDVFSRLI